MEEGGLEPCVLLVPRSWEEEGERAGERRGRKRQDMPFSSLDACERVEHEDAGNEGRESCAVEDRLWLSVMRRGSRSPRGSGFKLGRLVALSWLSSDGVSSSRRRTGFGESDLTRRPQKAKPVNK